MIIILLICECEVQHISHFSSRTLVDVIADYCSFSKLSIKLVLHGYEMFLRLELIYFYSLPTPPIHCSVILFLCPLFVICCCCYQTEGGVLISAVVRTTNIPHHQINLLLVIIAASLIHTTCHKMVHLRIPKSGPRKTTKKE